MKVAFVHVLPLEYYPPTRNMLVRFAREPGWEVRAWTTPNQRGQADWSHEGVEVSRGAHPGPASGRALRAAGPLAWHLRTAAAVAAWRPDALMYVEPHSALAPWLYYRVFRGDAPLFIHHHEYYAPEDYAGPGMRLLRRVRPLEHDALFPRAEWVSQTNSTRLHLLREWAPGVREAAAEVLPNYPTSAWLAAGQGAPAASRTLRMVYVGSASFEDTFIREVAEWAAARPDRVSLHVCGDNVHGDVWEGLAAMGASNVTLDPTGWPYEDLPALLTRFDVGLVLYKGNTLNFVHNVPNKATEYLGCGLEVWYPTEMEGLRRFHRDHPSLRLRELDFTRMPDVPPEVLPPSQASDGFPFTCERALDPLVARIVASAGDR